MIHTVLRDISLSHSPERKFGDNPRCQCGWFAMYCISSFVAVLITTSDACRNYCNPSLFLIPKLRHANELCKQEVH